MCYLIVRCVPFFLGTYEETEPLLQSNYSDFPLDLLEFAFKAYHVTLLFAFQLINYVELNGSLQLVMSTEKPFRQNTILNNKINVFKSL